MKIAVCGKGGAGKSTVSALIARGLVEKGYRVLLIDADESNFGLHRLLGVEQPVDLMESMGGKSGLKKNMGLAFREKQPVEYLSKELASADIANECIAESDGVRLVVMGKIHDPGEGCACPIGVLSKNFLINLRLADDEAVVIDTEAGTEHFGRGLDACCDLILGVVDPTYESFQLGKKMSDMAGKLFKKFFLVENKVSEQSREIMAQNVDRKKVAVSIPEDQTLFMDSLKGRKISASIPQAGDLCAFIIDNWKKPGL